MSILHGRMGWLGSESKVCQSASRMPAGLQILARTVKVISVLSELEDENQRSTHLSVRKHNATTITDEDALMHRCTTKSSKSLKVKFCHICKMVETNPTNSQQPRAVITYCVPENSTEGRTLLCQDLPSAMH